MIPTSCVSDGLHYGFFCLFEGKNFRLKLPEVYRARCCGSDYGWLIMVGHTRSIFLLNPFTRVSILLPRQSTLPIKRPLAVDSRYYIRKATLFSASPVANNNLDDCLVVAIYCTDNLAFCRPGNEAWTAIDDGNKKFEDIIFYDGKLYAINIKYDLILVELFPYPKETSCNITPPTEEEAEDPGLFNHPGRVNYKTPDHPKKTVYLVEFLGELLLVIRFFGIFSKSAMFKIFKLDQQGRCWIRVEELGDQILFIGTSTGFSVSALDYPQLRGNCIYFTYEYSRHSESIIYGYRPRHDFGVFHLEDNTIDFCKSRFSLSPPIWFTPISW
ncbi:putative F-box protein At3g25750 isoform X2 [Macadamia integrifolia]|nr:putative F-box protein At3g25750 isoform X2 [Macadamia integrifolia]